MTDASKGGAATLPSALGKRERVIQLSDEAGTVIVKRWAWSKSVAIINHLVQMVAEVPDAQAQKLKGKKTLDIAGAALEIFGARMIPLLQLCVREEDASKISDELPFEDVISILEAVIDLNLTEGFQKKAVGLWKRFTRSEKASQEPTR